MASMSMKTVAIILYVFSSTEQLSVIPLPGNICLYSCSHINTSGLLGELQSLSPFLPTFKAASPEVLTDAMNLAGVPQLLGTWFKFNWRPDGSIWGDVSLIRGCDQGVLIWSTDGSGAWKGFTQDILANAPVGAWAEKPDGTWVLAPTEGPTADVITLNYELSAVGAQYAYIDDSHGSPVITSSNGVFGAYFDPGTI
jgi:hypothetical protein